MERNPHLLFEGCLIGCWAIGAKVAYIYIRGEFYHVQQIMEAELAKAYAQGYVGKNIMGTGFDCDIVIHRGAGAYEAGEETALIESLEGKRAQPRIKPPFPAVVGPLQLPDRGQQRRDALQPAADPDRTAPSGSPSLGPEKNGGPKLFCVSGHVKKPGVFEASMKTTLRELILRPRRRHPRRPQAQGGDPRRVVGADPARRTSSTSRPASTTWRRPGRCWARPASS